MRTRTCSPGTSRRPMRSRIGRVDPGAPGFRTVVHRPRRESGVRLPPPTSSYDVEPREYNGDTDTARGSRHVRTYANSASRALVEVRTDRPVRPNGHPQ